MGGVKRWITVSSRHLCWLETPYMCPQRSLGSSTSRILQLRVNITFGHPPIKNRVVAIGNAQN